MSVHIDHLAQPSACQCHAGDVAFTLTGPPSWLPAQREHLTHFLTQPPGDVDLGQFTIDVHVDDLAFRNIMRDVAQLPTTNHVEPIPGLILLEAHQSSGHRCYAIAVDGIEHHAGAYAVTVRGPNIELFLHGRSPHPHRYPLRLIREAMLRTYEDAGGVLFHAAGVNLAGTGVMICGPRAAGKTTTLACLLRSRGAALLSNDRLILHRNVRVVAVPLPVPTALGTIQAFPELIRATTQAHSPLRDLNAAFGSTTKHSFSAREFATAFGANLAPAAELRMVVVPRLTDTTNPAQARQLGAEETREVLATSCFTPHDEFWVRPWLVPRQCPDAVLRHQAAAVTEHIAAAVPCVEVRFGIRNPISHLQRALAEVVGGIQ